MRLFSWHLGGVFGQVGGWRRRAGGERSGTRGLSKAARVFCGIDEAFYYRVLGLGC